MNIYLNLLKQLENEYSLENVKSSLGDCYTHFIIALSAIKNVKSEYINVNCSGDVANYISALKRNNNPKVKDVIHQVERVFAYELYHQWSLLLKSLKINDIVLNAEVFKIIENDSEYERVFPDIVLHESQGNMRKQYIACEIKRKEALLLVKEDIKVLCQYIEKLDFMCGIEIVTNATMNEVQQKIQMQDLPSSDKIVIITISKSLNIEIELYKNLMHKTIPTHC